MNESIAAIYERFSLPIYKYARRLSRDEMLADDITSETFARLSEKLVAGKGPQVNIRSYLYQTAFHLFIDYTRGCRRLAPLEIAEGVADEEATLLEDLVEARATVRQASWLMKVCLNADQRAAVALQCEGLSLKASAQMLGKQANNIKMIRHRAFARLRMVINAA